ncbi:VOC family protein [Alteromonas halophila]|uniref:Glyoxalase/bleomycin resistance protein/dioxygenase superfamily protein n=1 Tax=Alteromonas halophila TaxID=516698 RepID=A0A918JH75_9ALTE|nr:VOC family protein [Alteromonas halophila]GGW79418.1 glyoxalase/bleomycin resistance protein/dioxygenase superfamily protein [Alteromonas halophila]
MPQPFHLAIPVIDLAASAAFYGELLGCERGRSDAHWIDWNFFGHQLVTHKVAAMPEEPAPNQVDSHAVPVPHFGVVLDMDDWKALAHRLETAGVAFIVEPYLRFVGQPGEQATMFFRDPNGNALELKAFADPGQLFAT